MSFDPYARRRGVKIVQPPIPVRRHSKINEEEQDKMDADMAYRYLKHQEEREEKKRKTAVALVVAAGLAIGGVIIFGRPIT